MSFVCSTVLHAEKRIVRSPLSIWVETICHLLNNIIKLNNIDEQLEEFAVCLNQAGLIFAYYGDKGESRALCNQAIEFFSIFGEKIAKKKIRFYAIQPWINLGRLDRIEKKFEDSLSRFIFLYRQEKNLGIPETPDSPLESKIKRVVSEITDDDADMTALLKGVVTVEPAKTLLASSSYKQLLEAFAISKNIVGHSVLSWMLEAQFISLMQTNNHQKAREIIEIALEDVENLNKHVFLLREAELMYESPTLPGILQKIFTLMRGKNFSNITITDQLMFKKELALFLLKAGYLTESKTILEECYSEYTEINDEVGRINCLQIIIKNFEELARKYSPIFFELLDTTEYSFLNKNSKVKYDHKKKLQHAINQTFTYFNGNID